MGDGQTCLGCSATSTPEWRRGPMGTCPKDHVFYPRLTQASLGPRTLCNACGLVYAKLVSSMLPSTVKLLSVCDRLFSQIKKRFSNKTSGPKKAGSSKGSGGTTTAIGGGMGGHMHVIGPEESGDEGSDDDDYESHGRRSEIPD